MSKKKRPGAVYDVYTPAGVIKNRTLEEAQDYKRLYGYFYLKQK